MRRSAACSVALSENLRMLFTSRCTVILWIAKAVIPNGIRQRSSTVTSALSASLLSKSGNLSTNASTDTALCRCCFVRHRTSRAFTPIFNALEYDNGESRIVTIPLKIPSMLLILALSPDENGLYHRRRVNPDLKNYPQEKLDLMDDLIREKSEIEWKRRNEHAPRSDERGPDPDLDPDMNAFKALPLPPPTQGDLLTETKEEETLEKEKVAVVGDLLSLAGDEAVIADRLALALFDGGCGSGSDNAAAVSPWKAFNDFEVRETELVQSASYLSSQKAKLPGVNFNLMPSLSIDISSLQIRFPEFE